MGTFVASSFFCCFLFLLLNQSTALKCRTSSQQTDEQFRKIMQTCRKRYMDNEKDNSDSMSNLSDSYEDTSDSEEHMFDKKFLSERNRGNTRNSNSTKSNNMKIGENYKTESHRRVWNVQSYPSNQTSNTAFRARNITNNRGLLNSNRSKMRNNRMNSDNNNEHNDQHNHACVIQCFFNELNLVDQRGFPERIAVTGIMIQNIGDPELRDFVEESIIDCFHFLDSNMNKEKCKFSQDLLSCLADKGKERCEDWDDQ